METLPGTDPPAIYVIGGLPRTGKTTISEKLARSLNINCFETDHIRAMFDADPHSVIGYGNGAKVKTVTKAMRPYLERLIDCHASFDLPCVINGETIHPAMVGQSPYADRIRSCFLGISDAEKSFAGIREHAGERDWTRGVPDDKLLQMLGYYAGVSRKLERRCEQWDLPYYDVSENYVGAHAEAYSMLTAQSDKQLLLAVEQLCG